MHSPAARPAGLVVFVHGSGAAGADDFAWYADQLTGLDVACLVVDKVMDGYTGLRRDYNELARDTTEALVWARAQPGLAGVPVGLLGYSEGSWVATKAAARTPDIVDLLVLCSAPLTRPRNQTAYHRAKAGRNPRRRSPLGWLRYAATWAAMAVLTDYGNCDITEDLKTIPAPVALILGEDDPTLDVALACRIFHQTRHNTPAPIIVRGADHALPPDSPWIAQIADMLVTGPK